MMKAVGVHDRCTYKPMLVFQVDPQNELERRILARAGFGLSAEKQKTYLFFYDINNQDCTYDPFKLKDQVTCGAAARWIRDEQGYDALQPGEFIDCEYLRGETDTPMAFEEEFDYIPTNL